MEKREVPLRVYFNRVYLDTTVKKRREEKE